MRTQALGEGPNWLQMDSRKRWTLQGPHCSSSFTSDIVVNSLKDFLAGFNPGPQPFNLVSTLTTSIVHFGAPI